MFMLGKEGDAKGVTLNSNQDSLKKWLEGVKGGLAYVEAAALLQPAYIMRVPDDLVYD